MMGMTTGGGEALSASAGEGARKEAWGILRLALGLGLGVGMLELSLVLARPLWTATPLHVTGMTRRFPAMIPTSGVMIFGTCGIVLALGFWMFPRRAAWSSRYLLAFLTVLALGLTIRGLRSFDCMILGAGCAYQAVPWACAPRRVASLRRFLAWELSLLGMVWIALIVLCCGREWWTESRSLSKLGAPPKNAPNVLLIVLDTVRADRLSAYGYARETSPNLSRLAQSGARFDQAMATAPWTLPSHSSLLTGYWPHELATAKARPLDVHIPTLAEALAARGYFTAGFVANYFFCSHEHGLNRGFAHYEDDDLSPSAVLGSSGLGWLLLQAEAVVENACARLLDPTTPPVPALTFRRKDADRINRDFLSWLSVPRQRPFFAFLNYFDAHDPYLLPRGVGKHFGLYPTNAREATLLRDWHTLEKDKLSAGDRLLASDSYDDCIAFLDERVGRLFDTLKQRGILKDTVVIVTADHGEHLGEHHLFGHGASLYQPEIHVPLFIIYPPAVPSGLVVRAPVSLRDLPATILQLAGQSNDLQIPGTPLSRQWAPARLGSEEASTTVLSEVEDISLETPTPGISDSDRGPKRALTRNEGVYIVNGSGCEELYDLNSDPDELHDLSGQSAAQAILSTFRKSLKALLHEAETENHGNHPAASVAPTRITNRFSTPAQSQ
jgi:arylsulfatase A-like enzyme